MKRNRVIGAVLVGILVTAFVAPVSAHEHKALGSWDVTFGMTPEPVFTNQFYKTTWRFRAADGSPVSGLKDLRVTILFNGKPYGPFTVSEAHGDPGLYETPTIFAAPGEYRFVLNGAAEAAGVDVPFEIEFHKEILDAAIITVGG